MVNKEFEFEFILYTVSNYPFGIFKLFLKFMAV